MDIVRLLKPREWMVYTIDRPTPMQDLQKFSPQEMKALVQPIIDERITKVQIKGAVERMEGATLGLSQPQEMTGHNLISK